MKYIFDIKGQLIKSIDPFDRDISVNYYTTGGMMLRTDHIDRGTQRVVMDAIGLPVIASDAKGSEVLSSYDNLQRPTKIRAKDTAAEPFTSRQIMRYGDNSGLTNPENENLKGKLYEHFDEAGKLNYPEYDFKGNGLEYSRQVIEDAAVTVNQKYVVDWDNSPVLPSPMWTAF